MTKEVFKLIERMLSHSKLEEYKFSVFDVKIIDSNLHLLKFYDPSSESLEDNCETGWWLPGRTQVGYWLVDRPISKFHEDELSYRFEINNTAVIYILINKKEFKEFKTLLLLEEDGILFE